jgi:hypothetical protein
VIPPQLVYVDVGSLGPREALAYVEQVRECLYSTIQGRALLLPCGHAEGWYGRQMFGILAEDREGAFTRHCVVCGALPAECRL